MSAAIASGVKQIEYEDDDDDEYDLGWARQPTIRTDTAGQNVHYETRAIPLN